MKYNANAYSPYPVLRPHSSDFPGEHIATTLKHSRNGDILEMEVEFCVSESFLSKHIEKGDAKCCAMVYCTATCFSQMLTADRDGNVVVGSVPLHSLYGRVEVHPSIIANDDLVIRTETAHIEYGGAPIPASKGMRLGMDEPHYFSVSSMVPIESVFHLVPVDADALSDWEFEIVADPQDRYIAIRANPSTFEAFQSLRSQISLTSATVYLNALTTAIGVLFEQRDEEELPGGWAFSVRNEIMKQGIDWQNMYAGFVAQKLLKAPLSYLKEAL